MDFLQEEFVEFIQEDQWVVLPASIVQELQGVRASSPGIIPQHSRHHRWTGDYSFDDVNGDTLPLAAMDAMQFGHDRDHLLHGMLLEMGFPGWILSS